MNKTCFYKKCHYNQVWEKTRLLHGAVHFLKNSSKHHYFFKKNCNECQIPMCVLMKNQTIHLFICLIVFQIRVKSFLLTRTHSAGTGGKQVIHKTAVHEMQT